MSRTIFVWDIHWCFDEFLELLEKINFDYENDSLYLTGDLINKWPKWYELIDFLVNRPKIKSVIWNNEVNFLRYIAGLQDLNRIAGWEQDFRIIEGLCGNKNIENFQTLIKKGLFDKTYQKHNPLFEEYLKKFSDKHIEYILNLPLYVEAENWILLHWGLVPGKKLEEHHIDEITRIRQYNWKPWYEFYTWNKTVIYWHWAADGLRIRKNTKWLDSWCVYGKRLTAYIWETQEIVQVSAKKVYVEVE